MVRVLGQVELAAVGVVERRDLGVGDDHLSDDLALEHLLRDQLAAQSLAHVGGGEVALGQLLLEGLFGDVLAGVGERLVDFAVGYFDLQRRGPGDQDVLDDHLVQQGHYPTAETNLMIRFSELTKTRVSVGRNRRPNNWVVRLTDDALFNCPYTIASDVGTIGLNDVEAERLRTYLLKGGFLWVDDFWGESAWAHWENEIAKALPPSEFPIEDVPLSDPIFKSMLGEDSADPALSVLGGHRTARDVRVRRGDREPHFRAIRDREGRIIVVMTHNTDVADSWEREGSR